MVESSGGNWRMLAPLEGARLRSSAIDDLLAPFVANGLLITGLIAPDKVAGRLEPAHASHLLIRESGQTRVDMTFAPLSGGEVAFRLAGQSEAWRARGLSFETMTPDLSTLRSRSVWMLYGPAVTSIEVEGGKDSMRFDRGPSPTDAGAPTTGGDARWSVTVGGAPLPNASCAAVDGLVSALAVPGGLYAIGFADGAGDPEIPVLETKLRFKLMAGEVTDASLGPDPSGRCLLRVVGDPSTYLLGPPASSWCVLEPSRFTANRPGPAGARCAD